MYTGLEPILMKLDYSMKGETEHRKHDKRSEYRSKQTTAYRVTNTPMTPFYINDHMPQPFF